MKAIIVTVMYVVGLFIGDYLHYGQTEAWMMFQYNAWGYGGLALALALTDPRVSWRRILGRINAVLWACLIWLRSSMLAGIACPRCGGYRTIRRETKCCCRSCGTKF